MKNKLFFGMLAIMLVIGSMDSFAQDSTQVPKDYIGTWILEGQGSFIISADTFSIVSLDGRQMTAEIAFCQIIINEDSNTKQDYPNGIWLSVMREDGDASSGFQLFLSRDKKGIAIAFDGEIHTDELFIKR
ncbi:hypothetical protein FACS189491_05670 [Spirochaetia bacterium]|nr:hypothetical protein FACS189491_05670 [Spirochaetia bacterium]